MKKNQNNDNRHTNTKLKSAMDFFKQKKQKTEPPKQAHIEIDSTSKSSSEYSSTMVGVYKTDIFQIDSLLDTMKQILIYYTETKDNLLFNKDFKSKITSLKENLSKDSKELLSDENFEKNKNKDVSLDDVLYENMTLKLLLSKLDDLFFLINIKLFDNQGNFSQNYKENLSQISNMKYICDAVSSNDKNDSSILTFGSPKNKNDTKIEYSCLDGSLLPKSPKDESKNNKDNKLKISKDPKVAKLMSNDPDEGDNKNPKKPTKTEPKTSSNANNNEFQDIPGDVISDLINKFQEMEKFSDFLNFEYDQEESLKIIFEKIRELFYLYNTKLFSPLLDFINKKIKKSALTKKVNLVQTNEVNDCYENVVLMRKIFEDQFEGDLKEIKKYKDEKVKADNQYNNLKEEFDKQKVKWSEISNRNYGIYYKEMKESNDEFLKEFEKMEKARDEKIYARHEEQLKKNKELKKKIVSLENQIYSLNKKLENYNKAKEKEGDDYYKELMEQFEDAQTSYQERIEAMTDEYYKKKEALRQKCNLLEKENKKYKTVQDALVKKMATMDSLFSQ